MEEKLIDFLTSKQDAGYFKINDFLKSLYPIPKLNEQPVWSKQETSKSIKNLLNKMQKEGKIFILENRHNRLGAFYYEGDNPATKYYNLLNVDILAKI